MNHNYTPEEKTKKRDRRKKEYQHMAGALFAVFFLYAIMHLAGITCPIKYVTGVSCAGCGMTRAYLALLRLDFAGAFYYHPLFWLLPVAGIIFWLRNRIPRQCYRFLFVLIILVYIIVYLYRMFCAGDTVVVFRPQEGLIFRMIGLIRRM